MKSVQFQDVLKFRLGSRTACPDSLNLGADGRISILSIDKAIFRKKLPSGRYTYFILNSKVLDSIRSDRFPSLHKNVLAYNYVVSCVYGGKSTPLEAPLEGFDIVGLDLAVDLNLQDLAPQLGFSFAFFQRLLVGAYSSCSKKVVMTLDNFTRYVLKNNPSSKSAQSVFFELYNVSENKFTTRSEVPASSLLLEIQKKGSISSIPTDFYFGKEQLKRSRVSSSSFSFDLDVYDKGQKEGGVEAYRNITRFELRFRGGDYNRFKLTSGPLPDTVEGSPHSLVQANFLRFLDRAVLFRQRPGRRITKTSFSNLYRWPEDTWWTSIKERIFGSKVVHLDDFSAKLGGDQKNSDS